MTSIRVHLVDDHPVVRRGLKSLLSNHDDLDVVGESATVAEGQQQIAGLLPDVVLLDIRLPGESGLDLLRWLKQEQPQIKVLILTSFDDEEYVIEALRRGAHGFILKNSSDEMLCDAIRTVYRNGRVLSPQVAEHLVQQNIDVSGELESNETEFNSEELHILKMLAAGSGNEEIASELYVSVATAKRRLQRIFTKLDVNNRAQAIAEAIRRKLLE
jgi:DNA-binding NarL/FixJ family response regulator